MKPKTYTQQEVQEILNKYHKMYCTYYKHSTSKQDRLLNLQSFSLVYNIARELGIDLEN